jgi:hypothetical protein
MAGRMNDPFAIPNETRLFRRINPNWTTYDANRKERRPSSQNFQDSPDGTPMSVFAENIAQAAGELPPDFLTGQWSGFYLAAVTAGWMRECGQEVYPDPENQDAHDRFESHTAVRGPKDKQKLRSKLAKGCEWVIPPPNRFDPD